jgi:chemotaxis protein methyltransferase CheR
MVDNNQKIQSNSTISLHHSEFVRLSSFIMDHFGIKLPPAKKTLLECRLQKRLKVLQIGTFKEYTDYVLSSRGQYEEVSYMIDAVSTNKTDFFREPLHFDFLVRQGIHDYLELSGKQKLSVWSAGCSSGEEPYTIAMVLNELISANTSFDFNIMATDIADSVLRHAVTGIYNEEKTQVIPYNYKKKYLLKGKNAFEHKMKVSAEIRDKIEFRKYNLLSSDYSLVGKFDIIFCRNVLIYFDREIQYRILDQFCRVLKKGGYLFLGHTESINGFSLPLRPIKPTIYTKVSDGK